MSASSDHASASVGEKPSSCTRDDAASGRRSIDRKRAMRLLVIGYELSAGGWGLGCATRRGITNNVRVVVTQNLVVFLQDLLQLAVVLRVGLLHQPFEG